MTRKNTLLVLLPATVAVVPMALAAMPPAAAWDIGPWVRGRNYSEGMPAHPTPGPRGSLVMVFPIAGQGQIDAMTTPIGPLEGARQITLRYRIDAAPGTRFIADETPNEPATVSLYFQQAGDNWSGRGRSASYRWYSPGHAVVPLTPGQRTITVRFDEPWTNVNGQSKQETGNGFAAAMENADNIGLAFGSSSRRSHGVYATGPARFTLLSWQIN